MQMDAECNENDEAALPLQCGRRGRRGGGVGLKEEEDVEGEQENKVESG